jgi:hypothetical protein
MAEARINRSQSSRERDSLSPSSNRTYRFPVSGSPTRVDARLSQAVGCLLRLAPEFPAQQRDPKGQVRIRHNALRGPVRDGATIAQAALLSCNRNLREVRPLRSTGITPLPRYYEPVRLPAEADARLWIPARRCPRHLAGSPRTPCDSVDARPPQSPRAARRVPLLVASSTMAGFAISGRVATTIGVTRPNRVRVR